MKSRIALRLAGIVSAAAVLLVGILQVRAQDAGGSGRAERLRERRQIAARLEEERLLRLVRPDALRVTDAIPEALVKSGDRPLGADQLLGSGETYRGRETMEGQRKEATYGH